MKCCCGGHWEHVLITLLLIGATPGVTSAQGPLPEFFYRSDLDLAWASAYVVLEGGSRLAIPFLPVVDGRNSPYGTADYGRDVRVDAPLAFVPAGPNGFNLDGRAVLMAMDRPEGAGDAKHGGEFVERLRAVANAGAAAVVLFSFRQSHPFLLDEDGWLPASPSLPVVTITREAAGAVLASSTTRLEDVVNSWREGDAPEPSELISRLELEVDGRFQRVDTDHFVFRFQPGHFSSIDRIAEANDEAVAFLLDLFGGHVRSWSRTTVTYFPDFDSKVFFTHHWGSGLGSDHGIFLVRQEADTGGGLVVHEQTHILIGSNWGPSSSFMAEGVATYSENMATDPGDACSKVRRFRRTGQLMSLEEMLEIQVGTHGGTSIAYAAGGCFVRFLVEGHSMETLREVYELEARSFDERVRESTWRRVFGRDLGRVEREWLGWVEGLAL